MSLKAFLVKDLNSNRERFEANPNILIYVTFVDGSKATLTKNVVRTEALGYGLELKQGEGNNMGIEQGILAEVLKVAGS